jgi:hypothetical protein
MPVTGYLRKTTAAKGEPALFEIDPRQAGRGGAFRRHLRTANAGLTPLQAVLRYRDPVRIENQFREKFKHK